MYVTHRTQALSAKLTPDTPKEMTPETETVPSVYIPERFYYAGPVAGIFACGMGIFSASVSINQYIRADDTDKGKTEKDLNIANIAYIAFCVVVIGFLAYNIQCIKTLRS